MANAPPSGPVPPPLGGEVRAAAAVVVERMLTELMGRVYSPRLKLLTIQQVSEATNLGQSTIYRLMEQGKFPKPQRGLGKNLWRESALLAWNDDSDPN